MIWIRSQLAEPNMKDWSTGSGPMIDRKWMMNTKILKSNLKGNWWFVTGRILSFNIHLINFSFDSKKIWCGNKSTIFQSERTRRIDRETNRIFNVFLNVISGVDLKGLGWGMFWLKPRSSINVVKMFILIRLSISYKKKLKIYLCWYRYLGDNELSLGVS